MSTQQENDIVEPTTGKWACVPEFVKMMTLLFVINHVDHFRRFFGVYQTLTPSSAPLILNGHLKTCCWVLFCFFWGGVALGWAGSGRVFKIYYHANKQAQKYIVFAIDIKVLFKSAATHMISKSVNILHAKPPTWCLCVLLFGGLLVLGTVESN